MRVGDKKLPSELLAETVLHLLVVCSARFSSGWADVLVSTPGAVAILRGRATSTAVVVLALRSSIPDVRTFAEVVFDHCLVEDEAHGTPKAQQSRTVHRDAHLVVVQTCRHPAIRPAQAAPCLAQDWVVHAAAEHILVEGLQLCGHRDRDAKWRGVVLCVETHILRVQKLRHFPGCQGWSSHMVSRGRPRCRRNRQRGCRCG
mmetsp:Transcript_6681/g.25009  ORF Transcript_6681/g.25009 Transcript_6681/m.25009 type:complete len:202 (+) Transcript_6681:539-1144(+)